MLVRGRRSRDIKRKSVKARVKGRSRRGGGGNGGYGRRTISNAKREAAQQARGDKKKSLAAERERSISAIKDKDDAHLFLLNTMYGSLGEASATM
jgi:transposase